MSGHPFKIEGCPPMTLPNEPEINRVLDLALHLALEHLSNPVQASRYLIDLLLDNLEGQWLGEGLKWAQDMRNAAQEGEQP